MATTVQASPLARPGQHIRRVRPRSVLETLVERECEEGSGDMNSRPTSMIESSSGTNHMPRTIFPDVPTARRYSTFNGSSTSSGAPVRQAVQRRHTTLLGPTPGPGARREVRPLRSSPLAGPSLALSRDGTLTNESAESEANVRYRPNRLSSNPEAAAATLATLMKLEGKMPASAPTSPTGTLRGGALPAVAQDTADNASAPAPPSPVKQSATRRLSMGLKRLSSLPKLSHKDSPVDANAEASVKPSSRSRTYSLFSSQNKDNENVPPVPSIPVWARPSFMPSSPTSPRSATNETFPRSHEPRPNLARRPSTAPSTSSRNSTLSPHSALRPPHPTHAHVHFPHATPSQPSTSRNPELNWMSTAAPPKFSRLGLKAEGVVLPVSVKEARRRSSIRVPSDAASVRSRKSQSSLRSLAKSFQSVPDPVVPPVPPFRREPSASSSSLASSTGSLADSDAPATPSLSRASSESGASEHEVSTPPAVDELGVHQGLASARAEGDVVKPPGVELRVNDVMVEIIELRERREREAVAEIRTSGESKVGVGDAKVEKRGVPERKGTLKRVWKKVVGSVKG